MLMLDHFLLLCKHLHVFTHRESLSVASEQKKEDELWIRNQHMEA